MEQVGPRGITFQPDIYPAVLALLPRVPGARLLDVGAGEGYFCQLAAREGFAVEACDRSAERFVVPGVPFHRADLDEAIPLPEAAFDCVVSIEVVEHLRNQARFIGELLRVTKPGGTVVLTTPNILSLPSRWHFFLYGTTDCAPRPLDPALADPSEEHISPIGLPQILFWLEHHGGRLTRLSTNRFRRSAWLPALLLYPVLALALRAKLLRRKYAAFHPLYRRHIRWMLHPANLLGRITIAVARRLPPRGA
jgi:SAM-dependent methyltransferase